MLHHNNTGDKSKRWTKDAPFKSKMMVLGCVTLPLILNGHEYGCEDRDKESERQVQMRVKPKQPQTEWEPDVHATSSVSYQLGWVCKERGWIHITLF